MMLKEFTCARAIYIYFAAYGMGNGIPYAHFPSNDLILRFMVHDEILGKWLRIRRYYISLYILNINAG